MLLDYERYQRKSKIKKSRLIVFFLLLASLAGGTIFLISRFVRDDKDFPSLTLRSPEQRLDDRWAELIRIERTAAPAEKREEDQKKVLDELLRLSGDYLKNNPLSLKALLYHGFGSFYRALYESSFEARLPYIDQSIVSERRALLLAGPGLRPQLSYMLGRAYYYKRNYYYDLAVRYLEQALKLGYKKADAYEYLVLMYDEWGNTEKSIGYLEQAYEERKSDLYLYYLAKCYKKVNRTAEAGELLNRVIAGSQDAELLKECKFLLGEILFDEANYAQAERLYRDILKTDENSAEAHFRLALILEKLGDYAQYRYELRLTLEKDPGHSGARGRL
jgi:tetratricopeptide (TPR) repeat protein